MEHEAASMVLEKRLLERRRRTQQHVKAIASHSKKQFNVKKWLEKRKSLADLTKQLQVPTKGEVNFQGLTVLARTSR